MAPVLALVAVFIVLTMGRPILFRQNRPGYRERLFQLFKFRTMNEKKDAGGRLLPDENRLTPVGRFLRSTSLDELPELWNVLKGDMSLVGPRPLLPRYLDRYTAEQNRRHEIRPGLTGLAQVSGRNILSWEDRFLLDVWYVDHVTLWLDIKILWRTLLQVLLRKGISHPGSATMQEFLGNPSIAEKNHHTDHQDF